MRNLIITLAAVCFAPTAGVASVGSGELVGNSYLRAPALIQSRAIGTDALAVGETGRTPGTLILARGDQSGSGPGAGGQKGQKKGGHKGKRPEGKDNPGRGQGRGNSNRP
jgi:hypothetical protein